MNELLPCPFCGEQPRKVYKSSGQTTHIECPGCRAQFPRSTNENAYDDAWNTRAERTCHVNELDPLTQTLSMANGCAWGECSLCGCLTPDDSAYCVECGARVVSE